MPARKAETRARAAAVSERKMHQGASRQARGGDGWRRAGALVRSRSRRTEHRVKGVVGDPTELRPESECQQVEELGESTCLDSALMSKGHAPCSEGGGKGLRTTIMPDLWTVRRREGRSEGCALGRLDFLTVSELRESAL